MDAMEAILNRKSVREYTEREIDEEVVLQLLKAGMAGPSCTNARDWAFIVVKDPETLAKMADGNGKYAGPLRRAKLGVLVCGDTSRAFAQAPDYWVIDGAIAAQNMTLAAEALGLGCVWLGTYPQTQRVEAQRALFRLPEHIVPHSILAFGYPKGERGALHEKWEPDRVHREVW